MNLHHLKTSQLMNLYNLARPEGTTHVKKFSTKPVAEKRTAILLETKGVDFDAVMEKAFKAGVLAFNDIQVINPIVAEFLAKRAASAPSPLTASEERKYAPKGSPSPALKNETAEPIAVAAPVKKAKTKGGKKPEPSPHFNLRCPVCNFYAKTTAEYMRLGRLVCPVDAKHGKLLTAEERGERRGR